MIFHSFLSFSFHRKPKTNQKETQSFIFNFKKKKKKKIAPIYATAYREKKPPKTHRPIFFFLFLRLLLHTNPPNSCAWGIAWKTGQVYFSRWMVTERICGVWRSGGRDQVQRRMPLMRGVCGRLDGVNKWDLVRI